MPNLSNYLKQSSLTYSDVVRDLTDYVNSLPEGSKPKDLFLGSEGKLIIDYLAAEHSDIAYKIIMGFCENYLIYANKSENIIANAESKGYNVPRGSNVTLQITYVSNSSNPIGYLDEVGSLEDYGLYSLDNIDTTSVGQQLTLNVVVGQRKEMKYTVLDNEQLVYRFTNPKVSDDLRVYIDSNIPVNYTTSPVEALYGRLCVMTNSYGSIDLLDFSSMEAAQDYKESNDYTIIKQSEITVQYIELATIKYEGAIGTFNLGNIVNVVQTSAGRSPATPVEIQKNAIIYQQTQNRVVARRDYKKVTKLHVPGIINVNDYDYSPSTVAVTYVMKSGLPMTKSELEELTDYLNKTRVAGIPLPYIIGSNAVTLTLNVHTTLYNYVDSQVLTDKFLQEFEFFTYQPGVELSFNELETNCEEPDSVQVVRFSFNSVNYPAGEYCPLGTVVQPGNGNAYLAAAYVMRTGENEPNWPIDMETIVEDNSVRWKPIPFYDAPYWSAKDLMYQGQIRLPKLANGMAYEVEPMKFITPNESVVQEGYTGDILWKMTTYDSTAPYCSPGMQVQYGEIYNMPGIPDTSWVVSGFRKKAPIEQPDWDPTADYTLAGDVMFKRIPLEGSVIAKDAVLTLPWNSYLVMDCEIV